MWITIVKTRIQRSTEDDLGAIRDWLVDEQEAGVEGNFLCNWSWIDEGHRKGELLVYRDDGGAPAGYLTGKLDTATILQVRSDVRGYGIGRKLVEDRIARIRRSNRPDGILHIRCAPRTSVPFWEKMGFTVLRGESHADGVYAYRVIPKRHTLSDGLPATVTILSYAEEKKWKSDATPLTGTLLDARIDSAGVVHLAERAYIFSEFSRHGPGDPVVEIRLNGRQLCCDKAKYPELRALGVRDCKHGYFVDKITLPGTFGSYDVEPL